MLRAESPTASPSDPAAAAVHGLRAGGRSTSRAAAATGDCAGRLDAVRGERQFRQTADREAAPPYERCDRPARSPAQTGRELGRELLAKARPLHPFKDLAVLPVVPLEIGTGG